MNQLSPLFLAVSHGSTIVLRRELRSRRVGWFRRVAADLLKPARDAFRAEEAAKPCFCHALFLRIFRRATPVNSHA